MLAAERTLAASSRLIALGHFWPPACLRIEAPEDRIRHQAMRRCLWLQRILSTDLWVVTSCLCCRAWMRSAFRAAQPHPGF